MCAREYLSRCDVRQTRELVWLGSPRSKEWHLYGDVKHFSRHSSTLRMFWYTKSTVFKILPSIGRKSQSFLGSSKNSRRLFRERGNGNKKYWTYLQYNCFQYIQRRHRKLRVRKYAFWCRELVQLMHGQGLRESILEFQDRSWRNGTQNLLHLNRLAYRPDDSGWRKHVYVLCPSIQSQELVQKPNRENICFGYLYKKIYKNIKKI